MSNTSNKVPFLPFLLDTSSKILLDGRKRSKQHVQQRPTEQPMCRIYIYFNKNIYYYPTSSYILKSILCWTVGQLDVCFEIFSFQNLCVYASLF